MSAPARGVRQVGKARLYVEDTGGDGPLIVFAHGLLMSTEMYRAQIAALRDRYRCVAFDFRGQGESPLAASGYDMDTLAGDAAALVESLGAGPAHWVGLSMGGFVGIRLAARRPELVRSLVLLDTAADPEPRRSARKYAAMLVLSRAVGVKPFIPTAMAALFGTTWRRDPARADERAAMRATLRSRDPEGVRRATRGVIDRPPCVELLARIKVPTLVASGEEDTAITPARSRPLAAGIPGARFELIPRAGHSSTIENPAAVTALITAHLAAIP
ncbi:MAG: alpha/beta hydrolase [Deltaproteobacteria bacterium]|nr:alpha/beta hydrolase [Deltaproteobacteria bacterium]